jgi:hypothetical protein
MARHKTPFTNRFICRGRWGSVGLRGGADGISDPDPAQFGVFVNGLASTVYNVAVGGTDFGDYYAGTHANYRSSINGATYGSALSDVPLTTSYFGYPTLYKTNGPCGSAPGANLLCPAGGSGGPSNCATGASAGGINRGTPSNGTRRGWAKPSWQAVAERGRHEWDRAALTHCSQLLH